MVRRPGLGKVPKSRGAKKFKDASLYSALSRRSRLEQSRAAKKGRVLPRRVPKIRSTAYPTGEQKHVSVVQKRKERPGPLERFFNAIRDLFKRKTRK